MGLQGAGWASVLVLGRFSSAHVWTVEGASGRTRASGCTFVSEGAFGVVAPRVPVSGGTVVVCGPIPEGTRSAGPAPAPGCGHGRACAGVLGLPCAFGLTFAPGCAAGGQGLGCAAEPVLASGCAAGGRGLGCGLGCAVCGQGPDCIGVSELDCAVGLACAGTPALDCAHGLGCACVVGPDPDVPVPVCCQGRACVGASELGCAIGPAPACCQGLGCVVGPTPTGPVPACDHVPGLGCTPLPGVVAGVPMLTGAVVGPCGHMPVWAVPACVPGPGCAPGWTCEPWMLAPNCAVGVHAGPCAAGASCPAPCCPIGACGAAPAWAGVGVGFCRGFISVMQCVQNVAPSSS